MKIDLKYRIPIVGTYGRMQGKCNDCGYFVGIEHLGNHIIGFNDSLAILECPACFEKQHFHHHDVMYEGFLDAIEEGTQIHWKKNEKRND